MEDPVVQNRQPAETPRADREIQILTDRRGLPWRDMPSLSGSEVLNRILGADDPGGLVQGLPCEDFFWLVKKIGETDSLALLELASVDQWQYLLDLELWNQDRLDVSHTSHWLSLLRQAHCSQLVRWLFSEGEYLAYHHFFRTVEVVVEGSKDEVLDLPDGFFSLDGVLYIRVRDPAGRQDMETLIRAMAGEDFQRYQSLFLGLAGVLPAEVEEELYRLRNVRLAEHGFLPREEALAVYSPLDPAVLRGEENGGLCALSGDEESRALVPVLPLAHSGPRNLFMDVVGGIRDSVLLDRLRLEFAGLANQILSADGVAVREVDVLVEACRRAASLVNLAIESVSGRDPGAALDLLRRHPLVTLFRVGFGMALKLKWEAERWLKESWFSREGMGVDFWGESRGGILKGLLAKRPRYYIGSSAREGEYKDFEWVSELDECRKVLHGVMALDGLLDNLAESCRIRDLPRYADATCYSYLFNLWSRIFLKREPGFKGISLAEARKLFARLRQGEKKPPYRMTGYEKRFVRDLMCRAANLDSATAEILEESLSQLWKEFQEEYEWVSPGDLDPRYSRFVGIRFGP